MVLIWVLTRQVLNDEFAVGRAYQTAHVVPITALNQSRHVQVADGGTVGVLEGGAIGSAGGMVESQRMAIAVERSLEWVFSAARHRRHADVVAQHHGLATETVQISIYLHASAEVVPAFGSLDGVGIAALRDVVFIQRVCNRGVDVHILSGHV